MLAMRLVGYGWKDIGIECTGSLRGVVLGLALGIGIFAIAYLFRGMLPY